MKIAFGKLCVTLCGRFGPNEGGVAGLVLRGYQAQPGGFLRTVDRIGGKYAAKWGVQIAGINFQTRSSVGIMELLPLLSFIYVKNIFL